MERKVEKHLKPFKIEKIIENNEPYLKIGSELKPFISKTSNKQIVNKLLSSIIKPPTSIETWINIFPYLETEDWDPIFSRTFKTIRETSLQSFQYQILNRILNCNDRLYKWKIKNNKYIANAMVSPTG